VLPGTVRVEQEDWERPDRTRWVDALHRAVARCDAPPMLAHSVGCLAVVHHAARELEGGRAPRVAAALLVAPADVEKAEGLGPCASFGPIPLIRLPFPALLVASRTDPYLAMPRAHTLADAWEAGSSTWATRAT
jgi:predicted alpha/beta hydrolase family esterase